MPAAITAVRGGVGQKPDDARHRRQDDVRFASVYGSMEAVGFEFRTSQITSQSLHFVDFQLGGVGRPFPRDSLGTYGSGFESTGKEIQRSLSGDASHITND